MQVYRNGPRRSVTECSLWLLQLAALSFCLGAALPASARAFTFETRWDVALPDSQFDPKALIRVEHGYLIAGDHTSFGARAIRTDDSGRVLWQYTLPPSTDPEDSQHGSGPEFKDAATLPDGSTVLCGQTPDHRNDATALLVRLDRQGNLVSTQQLVSPAGGQGGYGRFMRCVSDGRRVIVAGAVTKLLDTRDNSLVYFWLLALNDRGSIQWQKLVPISMNNVDQLSRPEFLSNGDILVAGWRSGQRKTTALLRVGRDGQLRVQSELSGVHSLARRPSPSSPIRLVSDDAAGPKTFTVLSADLQVQAQQASELSGYASEVTYTLPDGSSLLFGAYWNRMRGPRVVIVTPRNEIAAEFPLDLRIPGSAVHSEPIADAAPAGRPGEFATLRRVYVEEPPGSGHGSIALHLALIRVDQASPHN